MNYRKEYQNFFLKTEAGKAFMTEIERMINANHENAEKDSDKSTSFSQRARGNREVLEHIQSTMVEPKKGKSM